MGKVVDYINQNLSLQDEYERIFNKKMPSGKFICPNPSHRHVSMTPSCKAYGNVFKCFGQCNRVFGVYDLLKWYDPDRINEVKSSMVLSSAVTTRNEPLVKVKVDRTLSLKQILLNITGIWPEVTKK